MSDDLANEVRAAVELMVRDHALAGDDFDRGLWQELCATGFHLVGVPEKFGGSGGGLREAAAVAEVAAFHAAVVPTVEAGLLGGWLLAQAGVAVPEGLAVAALDGTDLQNGRLSGRLRTPWGRYADHVVVLVRSDGRAMVTVVPAAAAAIARADNLAGEPRDVLIFDDVAVNDLAATTVDADDLLRRAALGRSVQLAGAARAVLKSACRHVADRIQFGRPLARMQAVQQHLATLAAEATAMRVSAEAAVLAVEAGDDPTVAVAAAKATTSAGASVVASIGHQLHGALGFSAEHPLGRATKRLWSWRDECGNESYWHDRLAAVAASHPGGWWSLVAGDVP